MDFHKITKRFMLGESFQAPSISSYLQSLKETLDGLKPSSKSDMRKLEIAKEHLREVRRNVRRLQERVDLLEEKISVLEENKEN